MGRDPGPDPGTEPVRRHGIYSRDRPLLTFDGGQSSVLLDGLTSADLSHIIMQYPAAAPEMQQVMTEYAALF